MSEVKWIKLKIDMFDDEKIKIIQSMPEGDSLCMIWIKLLTLAGKTNDGGYIYITDNLPYTDEMLSVVFNKPLNTIRLALDTFNKLQMIDSDAKGIYLLNFEKHQSLEKLEKIKEQNRLRKQKQREKEKQLPAPKENVTSHANVTHSHVIDIDIDLEEEKEIDKDKEKDIKEYITPSLGEFNNILLTKQEYKKLKEKNIISYIDTLSIYLENNPNKKYRSHYATILSWSRKDEKATPKPVRKEVVPSWLENKDKTIVSEVDVEVENNGKDSWKAEAERLKRELNGKY